MGTAWDHDRGFDNDFLGSHQRLLGSFAEQQRYDAGRAIFGSNHSLGAATTSRHSSRVERAVKTIG